MKTTTTILYAFMLILTINAAHAITETNITGLTTNSILRHNTDDLISTWDASNNVIFIGENGTTKTVNVNPYSASEAVLRAARGADTATLHAPEDLVWLCNATAKAICVIDYSAGTLNTLDITNVYPNGTVLATPTINFYTDDLYFMTYIYAGSNYRGYVFSADRTKNATTIGFTLTSNIGICNQDVPFNFCGDSYLKDEGTYYNVITTRALKNSPFQEYFLYASRFYLNSTLFTYASNIEGGASNTTSIAYQHQFLGNNWDKNFVPMPEVCRFSSAGLGNLYCTTAYINGSVHINPLNFTEYSYGNTDNFITIGTDFINYTTFDTDRDDATTDAYLFQDRDGYLRHYFDSQRTYNWTSYQPSIGLLLTHYTPGRYTRTVGNSFLIKNTNTIFTLVNPIEPTPPAPGNMSQNQTVTKYYNITPITNVTLDFTGKTLNALGISSTNQTAYLAGILNGIERLLTLDLTTPTNITTTEIQTLPDTPYSVDTNNGRIFVGTDNEIEVFETADGTETNNTLIASDGWAALFHNDRAYDVIMRTNTTGYVCDQHNEVDEYTVGNDPTGGNNFGSCYDLELDSARNLIFVDMNTDGILVLNTSDFSTELDNYDNTTGHGRDFGDLLDYENNQLLTTKNSQSIQLLDTTTPTAVTATANCNDAGAGTISSVDILNSTTLLAGTTNGRLIICDASNPDEETNTQWYTLPYNDGETITAIEYRAPYIHVVSTSTYALYTLQQLETTTNNPPTLATFTLSSTVANIGQNILVTTITNASNNEPEDIIRYGVRCDAATQPTFSESSSETRICNYSTAGTKNITVAVSDNFHAGQWYDQRSQLVTIAQNLSAGGLLRISVIDEQGNALQDATVQADNQTQQTNAIGEATFLTANTGLYEVRVDKAGYYTEIQNHYANSIIHVITLQTTAGANQTALEITVKDPGNNPLEQVLVSYTNTQTYDYDFDFTDATGFAVFKNIDAGTLSIQASKAGYQTTSAAVSIAPNQTTQYTITLTTTGAPAPLHADRNCSDAGIYLCGDVETSCTQDSDCLSDACNFGKCSRFNYSWCDANGYARGQKCVLAATSTSTLENTTNWVLNNLLYVLILLFIVVGIGFVLFSWRR